MLDYFDLTKRIKIPEYDENIRSILQLGIIASSSKRAIGKSFKEYLESSSLRDGIRLYKALMPDSTTITQKNIEEKILKSPWISNNLELYEELLNKGYSSIQAARLICTLGVVKCNILTFIKDGLKDEEKFAFNEFIHKIFSE
jgi:hypothetical protein